MKWNWGTGIVVAFILFCGFVISIVVAAFREDFDLVSDTYYQDELVYQQRIDDKANLATSGESIGLDQKTDEIILKFPEAFKGARGEVHFYHPSKAIFDKVFPIALNDANEQVIDKSQLVKGRFKVQMSWEANNETYYQEQEVFLK